MYFIFLPCSKLRINIDITVAMRCQCKSVSLKIFIMRSNVSTPYFYFHHRERIFFSVVGADVLDLAETMVASDGLQYEPVSVLLF